MIFNCKYFLKENYIENIENFKKERFFPSLFKFNNSICKLGKSCRFDLNNGKCICENYKGKII